MGTLANSEDPDEMLHNAALHQGLQYLLRRNQSPEKEIQYILEITTCYSSIHTLTHQDLIVALWKMPLDPDRVNTSMAKCECIA